MRASARRPEPTSAARGEHVEGVVSTLGVLLGRMKNGVLRGLTISDKVQELPDVPTMQELGYPRGLFTVWFAFLAPSGTPSEVVGALVPSIRAASQAPSFGAKLLALGIVEEYDAADSVTTRIREEQQALRSLLGK